MEDIVGRTAELAYLQNLMHEKKSAFVALYGRRRVGKTFLIRSAFANQFSFQLTGMANTDTEMQLTNFHLAIQKLYGAKKMEPAKTWLAAFNQLTTYLEKSKTVKKVIFFDELPWLDTTKSGFLQALEHFWNSWASARKDIILVVCGSSASWMLHKLIQNKGGLHNRVTKRMRIMPFTLAECEQLMRMRNSSMDRYQLIQLYMVMGGIPFYWDEVSKRLSATQQIAKICFGENGLLRTEFANLYNSLFNKAERHVQIVQTLATKAKGLTRDEIIANIKMVNGGGLTRLLTELEETGFIRKYLPFGKKSRTSLYQLVDFYSLFYLRFIKGKEVFDKNHWLKMLDSPSYRTWSGYAFENVCLYHIDQLKQALGVQGVLTDVYSWRGKSDEGAAQVDLVIDRRDQVINLCEMKYSINAFAIDKKYDTVLRNKIAAFKHSTKTRKAIFLTLVTTFGLQQNNYAMGLVQNDIKMDALFLPSSNE
jgi:uncharacterized protein